MHIRGFSTNMYGWTERWKRDGKTPDWGEIFHACAAAGLDAVEIDPIAEKLEPVRANGLAVSASYVGLPLHLPFEKLKTGETVLPVAERLAAAAGTDLLLNADPDNWRNPPAKSEDDFKRQGENLTRIAELVDPMGIKACLHNHAADNHNARGELRSVTEYAGKNAGLCLDSGWAYVAGCDPVEWVSTYPERVYAFHLRNQKGNIPAEDLLEGDIDIEALVNNQALNRYDGWIGLELWHPGSMEPVRTMTEDVRRSLEFLKAFL